MASILEHSDSESVPEEYTKGLRGGRTGLRYKAARGMFTEAGRLTRRRSYERPRAEWLSGGETCEGLKMWSQTPTGPREVLLRKPASHRGGDGTARTGGFFPVVTRSGSLKGGQEAGSGGKKLRRSKGRSPS